MQMRGFGNVSRNSQEKLSFGILSRPPCAATMIFSITYSKSLVLPKTNERINLLRAVGSSFLTYHIHKYAGYRRCSRFQKHAAQVNWRLQTAQFLSISQSCDRPVTRPFPCDCLQMKEVLKHQQILFWLRHKKRNFKDYLRS